MFLFWNLKITKFDHFQNNLLHYNLIIANTFDCLVNDFIIIKQIFWIRILFITICNSIIYVGA